MKGILYFDWLPEQTKCFYHPCSGHPLCPANGVVEHNITFHGDFPSRRSNDHRKSRKNFCLSNESANFNGFGKKPLKLVPQANPKAAFNSADGREVAATPLKDLSIRKRSARSIFISPASTKWMIIHNLTSFPLFNVPENELISTLKIRSILWRNIPFKIQSGYFPYRKINSRVGNQLTGPLLLASFRPPHCLLFPVSVFTEWISTYRRALPGNVGRTWAPFLLRSRCRKWTSKPAQFS